MRRLVRLELAHLTLIPFVPVRTALGMSGLDKRHLRRLNIQRRLKRPEIFIQNLRGIVSELYTAVQTTR